MDRDMLHVIEPQKNCSAAVIFLHGSGDIGVEFYKWIKFLIGDFSFPHIKLYFPTAALRPYKLFNNGQLDNVWFDRYDLTPEVPEHLETLESTCKEMKELIDKIKEDEKISADRIIIGGFSMGGCLALHMAYRHSPGLAGVFALSSFLNNGSAILKEAKSKTTPLYMCHGDEDRMIPISWGEKSFKDLQGIGIQGDFVTYKGVMHEIREKEIRELFQWIQKMLPDKQDKN